MSFCWMCGHKHGDNPKDTRARMLRDAVRRHGITDEYLNGAFVHKSADNRAHDMAKTEAWVAVGISPASAGYVAAWSWTPKDIPSFTDEELMGANGIGKTVVMRLRNMEANAEEVWQAKYRAAKGFWYPACVEWRSKAERKRNKQLQKSGGSQ